MEKFQKQTSNDLNSLKTQISLFQVSEINVIYNPKFKASERPKVTTSKQVYDIFNNQWDKDIIELKEQFKIMLLNRANKVIGIYEVSNGGISGTVADPKLIFSTALKACASNIILSHNHPSGNLTPSEADKRMTQKIKAGGELLDITVLDHVIITAEGYFSFADEGLL